MRARILPLLLAALCFALAVLPYMYAGRVTMRTPPGWERLGSAVLDIPPLPLEEVYSPEGVSTGRFDRPVNRTVFPIPFEIAGYRFLAVDTWQDASGCHLRVRHDNFEGDLTVSAGRSTGVEVGGLRLYITGASLPPVEGDWRRSNGEYFYGFRSVELSLFRVPVPPSYSVPGWLVQGLASAGLVLFGCILIRGGNRLGFLPVLGGIGFLVALVFWAPEVTFPVRPLLRPARWVRQTTGQNASLIWYATPGFREIAVCDNLDGTHRITVYDSTPRAISSWEFSCNSPVHFVMISSDGSRVLHASLIESGSRIDLFEIDGTLLWSRTFPLSLRGMKFYFDYEGRRHVLVTTSRAVYVLSDSGTIEFQVTHQDDIAADTLDGAAFLVVAKNRDNLQFYDSYTFSLYWETPLKVDTTWLSVDWVWAAYYGGVALVRASEGLFYYRVPTGLVIRTDYARSCAITEDGQYFVRGYDYGTELWTPSGLYKHWNIPSRWVAITKDGSQIVASSDSKLYYLKKDLDAPVWEISYSESMSLNEMAIPCAGTDQILVSFISWESLAKNQLALLKYKYHLDVTVEPEGAAVVRVDDRYAPYSEDRNPGDTVHVYLVAVKPGYVFLGMKGNWSENYDLVLENEAWVYMDNDKQIVFRLAYLPPPTLSVQAAQLYIHQTQTFSWTAVPSAVSYELWVDNNPDFSSPENVIFTPQTSYTLACDTLGTFYARVRALDSKGNASGWSNTVSYSVVPLPPPSGFSCSSPTVYRGQTQTFSWNPVAGAVGYELQIDTDSVFPNPATYSTSETSYTVVCRELGTFYARVRAVDGEWSNTVSYSVVAPAAPTALIVENYKVYRGGTQTFYWERIEGVVSYELQVDVSEAFTNPAVYTTTENRYEIVCETIGTFYARVRGFDAAGYPTDWSLTVSYEVALLPVELFIKHTSLMEGDSQTFWWSPSAEASYYELELRRFEELYGTYQMTETVYSMTMTLYGTYSARVRYVTAAGETSDWSNTVTFTVEPVVYLGPPPSPPPLEELPIAVSQPILPHVVVSLFGALGKVAGVYTLSVLLVVAGTLLLILPWRRF